jgi:hypothetical protein
LSDIDRDLHAVAFAKPPESGYNLGFAEIRPVAGALAGALN